MAQVTGVSWCDHTFNGWWGCAKVSPACDNCYAERDSKRFAAGQVLWGVDAARRTFGDKHWDEPLRWDDRAAERIGRGLQHHRSRVFCSSMSDVLDKNAPEGARPRLWRLIMATPNLEWLLLTKRIGNARDMLPPDWLMPGGWPRNVRMGATICNDEERRRDLPKLLGLRTPNFISVGPMLGPVDITDEMGLVQTPLGYEYANRAMARWHVHWVVCEGESGSAARPTHPDWVRSLRDQCAAAKVPFHFKQWGEWAELDGHLPTRRVVESDPDWPAKVAQAHGFISLAGHFVRTMADVDRGSSVPYRGMIRPGRKATGNLLDGVAHQAFPS